MEKITHEIININSDLEVHFHVSIDNGKNLAPHWHNSIEIIYMLEGTVNFSIGGDKVSLKEEDLYVINSKIIHSAVSRKNKALVLQIPISMLEKYIPNYDLLYFDINMNVTSKKELKRLQRVKEIFREMHSIYKNKDGIYILKFNSLLYDLLYLLVQYYSRYLLEEEIMRNNKSVNKIKDIMLYINKNHSKNITVKGIAQIFNYNADYLSRFFKQHINMTIIQYLYEIRVNYIYMDLFKSDLPIGKIFERHGCLNYKVAMRYFKEKYGLTPKEVRMQKKFL